MKRLIKPPIQLLLWLGGAILLGVTGWSLVSLKLLDETQTQQSSTVSVKIPDFSALSAPDVNRYAHIVDTPLFWESRKKLEPEIPPAPVIVEAPPVDTTLPQGRLIGIVDLGNSVFAMMENAAGGTVQLRTGDTWGAWTVKGIDPDRVFLTLGTQQQEIPLVADFSAPQENPRMAHARAIRQQVVSQQQEAMPTSPAVNTEAVATTGGTLPLAEAQPPMPVQPLSVEEALAARQRLMASRWGALTGDTASPSR